MKEKWFSFKGIAVFDHEQKRFWHRNEIKELAKEMWNDCEMNDITSNPDNSDLIFVFKNEFPQYSTYGKDGWIQEYWDDCGRWEMIEIPTHFGFGVFIGNTERFTELIKEFKQRGNN